MVFQETISEVGSKYDHNFSMFLFRVRNDMILAHVL